jgi:hypothetical protein
MANPLDMSDEEVSGMSLEQIREDIQNSEQDFEDEDGQADSQDTATEEVPGSDGETGQVPVQKSDAEQDTKQPVSEKRAEDLYAEARIQAEKDTQEPASGPIDYKSEYEKLLAPFRANKQDMKVNSVEDARRLMSMGANYHKKMVELKPNLKILKALSSNGLLTEDKVNFLIDLHKGKPEAIAKFLKDSEINPLDLDLDTSASYQPSYHLASDKEMELDEVLDEIRSTDSFSRTMSELTEKWDAESKRVLLDQPQIIRVINEHISLGIYDEIMNIVAQERVFGRLEGLSDLAAYKTVGDALNAKGAFRKFQKADTNEDTGRRQQESKIKDRKKAAGSPKTGSTRSFPSDFNPLAMSDAEFEKLGVESY